MKFTNRKSNAGTNKSLGLLAAGSIAAALMMVAPSALADTDTDSLQTEAELAAIDEPPPPQGRVRANKGFQMALGVGYAIPLGDVDPSLTQSDFMSGQLPLILDIGYKSMPNIYVGGYVGYGFGQAGDMVKSVCSDYTVTCSLNTFRIGVMLQYHFLPGEKINPYLGYGLGYESATFSATGPGGTAEITAGGFELARLTFGADFRANSAIGFGPYVDLGAGMYSKISDGTNSADIEDPTMHGWLNFGARVTLFP